MALRTEAVGTMPSVKYSYEPLPNPTSIRLLEPLPGQRGDSLVGRLFITDLSYAPPFEAISYVWGTPDDPTNMKLLSNAMIQIGTTLESHFNNAGRLKHRESCGLIVFVLIREASERNLIRSPKWVSSTKLRFEFSCLWEKTMRPALRRKLSLT